MITIRWIKVVVVSLYLQSANAQYLQGDLFVDDNTADGMYEANTSPFTEDITGEKEEKTVPESKFRKNSEKMSIVS